METKHTPGPWALETVPTTCGVCHKVGPFPGKRPVDKPRYACLYADYPSKGNQPDDELEANARLIAAAPDLLQELKNIANADTVEWDDPTEFEAWAKNRARAAIAKATGEQA